MNRRSTLSLVLGVMAFGVAAGAYSDSQESLIRRYPFDPACPWGRIANGGGMIVRCLSEVEARAFARSAPPAPASPSASASASASATVAGAASAQASAAPPASASASSAAVTPPKGQDFGVIVGPVVADSGELPLGKLTQAKDRYKKCVLDNGGLRGDVGEVQVRFLVRTKGIAEGVTVNKRTNVSAEAARCVADVVDRRKVGVPEEPLVGATLTVKFSKSGE